MAMKNIYSVAGVVDTYVDGPLIKVFWKLLSNKKVLYESCKAQLETVQQGYIQVIIIDVSDASGTPPMEVQKWFAEELFPGFKACAQFKGLINVLPSQSITKMGAKRWKEVAESDQFGFLVYETEEMIVAEEIAKEMIK